MPFAEAIAERAVGQYPLSIATSLAIESACGVHPDIIVETAPILQYQELWVNVRTLFRNFMGSLDKTGFKAVMPPQIAEALSQEMDAITSIIAVGSHGKTEVVYYYSNYAGLETKYKHAVVRRDTTDRQKEYTAIHDQTVKILLHEHSDEIRGFDLKVEPDDYPKALMLTHYAYDLLSWSRFAHLDLLESHTGAIKSRAQWYTKYYEGKSLPMIPFREDFLQVFGDSETFRPMDHKLRKEIVEIATRYNWTAVSTREKLKYGIDQMQNPFAKAVLRDILVA